MYESSSSLKTSIAYRADIDGLRAIAVLAVIIYHAFPSILPGGFIGVDIFFVISGFLITSIIWNKFQTKSFSLIEFYKRRIKRIFPALLLVLFTSFIAGWHLLLEQEFSNLGKHISSGIASISNIVLFNEAGYFDVDSDTKPLLHLWSLGVEEQFYLVWPLFLFICSLKKNTLWILLPLLIMISFIANVVLVSSYPTAVFYLPFTRLWELAFGGLIALIFIQEKKPSVSNTSKTGINFYERLTIIFSCNTNFLSVLGVFLIFSGFYFIDDQKYFPGWYALLPVIGTCLVIIARPSAWINHYLLGHKAVVFIGLISYPLYLWHWPLLTFGRLIYGDSLSVIAKIMLLILTFVLSYFTYRLIEVPLRHSNLINKPVCILLIFSFIIFGAGLNVYTRNGLSFRNVVDINFVHRSDPTTNSIDHFLINECGFEDMKTQKLFKYCQSDKRDQIRYVMLGDSKAESLFPGVVRTSKMDARWMFIGGRGDNGVPIPLLSQDHYPKEYYELISTAINTINKNSDIKVVVLTTAMRSFFNISDRSGKAHNTFYNELYLDQLSNTQNKTIAYNGLSSVVELFVNNGKQVVIVEDNPPLKEAAYCGYRITPFDFLNKLVQKSNIKIDNCQLSFSEFKQKKKNYDILLKKISKNFKDNVSIFPTVSILCDEENNVCRQTKNGKVLYSYSDHISGYGANLIGAELNLYLKNLTN